VIFPSLTIVLRRDTRNKIIAVVKQMTPEGLKEGSNLLRGKHPATFRDAKTLVQAMLDGKAKELIFEKESTEWERDE
jgi:hypothetical protein